MKYVFSIACLLLILSFSNANFSYLELHFEPGQIELNEEQKAEIKEFVKTLRSGNQFSIYPLTKDEVNDRLIYSKLAQKQAQAIAEYAKSIGLEYVGIPRNFPSKHRGISTRVNLKYYKEDLVVKAKNPNPFPKKPSQFFTIDPNKDTILVGKEGTVLYLKAGAFQSVKPVKVELAEYYSMDDYVKAGLQTSSNGQMIETGGTIYLDAREASSGKKVEVNPNTGIGIDFTMGKDKPGMEVFVRDPASTDEVNWILPQSRKREGSWEMTETIVDHEGNVISEKVFTSRKEWEEHLRRKKEAKEKKIKAEKVKKESREKMAGMLTAFNLGWINCDRFIDAQLVPFSFNASAEQNAQYYLVFQDVRGVMHANASNGLVQFGSVPFGGEATLIAFTLADGKAQFFQQKVSIGSKQKIAIVMKEVGEQFLKNQLAKLKD